MFDGVLRWVECGRPILVSSRAQRGRVGASYAYPGGGRQLLDAGAIFAYGRRPGQARIDAMLALGARYDHARLRALFGEA
jgi:L-asparaginase